MQAKSECRFEGVHYEAGDRVQVSEEDAERMIESGLFE